MPRAPSLPTLFVRTRLPMPTSSRLSPATEPLTNPPTLRTATLCLRYRAEGRVHLPSPPAHVWRGQLGYYLHRLASEAEHEQDLSLYQRLFRTPRSAVGVPDYDGRLLGALGLAGQHVPHPFVVRHAKPEAPATDRRLQPGAETVVEMRLLGAALRHLPPLTALFETIGADGLGRRVEQRGGQKARGPVTLVEATLAMGPVTLSLYDGTEWTLPPTCGPELYEQAAAMAPAPDAASDAVPENREALSLTFRTPTRLRHAGDLVRPNRLDADALAATLYRRVAGLAVCYAPGDHEETTLQEWQDGFKALGAPTTLATGDVEWVTDRRYSHRQERRVPAGGLVGTVRLAAPPEALRTWARWLRQAETLHLGGGTAMGLGRLQMD